MNPLTKKFIKWLGGSALLKRPRRAVSSFLEHYYKTKGTGMLIYDFSSRSQADGDQLIKKIKAETDMLMADQEAYLIYETVKKLEKISGDIAEVGVYRGASAKIIKSASAKTLHLFDTFAGLPELSAHDNAAQFQAGTMLTSLAAVQELLSDFRDVYFYKGLFPQTAGPVADKQFSFVNLDTDIYESTKAGLEFFYPRLVQGGVIICHDYAWADGVKKAVDEFFADKREIIIEPFATSQALIVKL